MTTYQNILNNLSRLQNTFKYDEINGWCGYYYIKQVIDSRIYEDFFNKYNNTNSQIDGSVRWTQTQLCGQLLDFKLTLCEKSITNNTQISKLIIEMKKIISIILEDNLYNKFFNMCHLNMKLDINVLYNFVIIQYSIMSKNLKDSDNIIALKEELIKHNIKLQKLKHDICINRVFLYYLSL